MLLFKFKQVVNYFETIHKYLFLFFLFSPVAVLLSLVKEKGKSNGIWRNMM